MSKLSLKVLWQQVYYYFQESDQHNSVYLLVYTVVGWLCTVCNIFSIFSLAVIQFLVTTSQYFLFILSKLLITYKPNPCLMTEGSLMSPSVPGPRPLFPCLDA